MPDKIESGDNKKLCRLLKSIGTLLACQSAKACEAFPSLTGQVKGNKVRLEKHYFQGVPMIIGVPREIKKEEYRIGITPKGAEELRKAGNTVLVEHGAGQGSGFSDEDYLASDCDIVDKQSLFKNADLIVKVKEPMSEEYDYFRTGQALFTFLHLAPNPDLVGMLLAKKISAFAYETLEEDGALPLLAPMSEIAGRMAPIMAAYFLQKKHGGEGVFPAGTVGVAPAKCVILGAGVVGTNAARVASALGMDTVVLNPNMERLRRLDEVFMGRVKTIPLDPVSLADILTEADILICAILVRGEKTPVLITREMLRSMKRGAVAVDVSVDQGGCLETTVPRTHEDPVYEAEGVIHYTVANMPGAYPRTATLALTNVTLPYIKMMAEAGVEGAVAASDPLRSALNVYRGEVVHPGLARSMGIEPADIDQLISVKPQI
jgi:alanine dehydrogenase